MNTEPNIGFRVQMKFDRIAPEVINGFKGWSSCNVCDANGRHGAMDYQIKPLNQDWYFVGTAITVRARPVDNLIVYKALEIAQPGDVLVITNENSTLAAILGDLVVSIAKAKGLSGIVTDGLARDAAGIRELNLPVFVRGLSPNSPFKDGPGEINFPITCGGVVVHPGDVVIGDEDGVVVVSKEDAPIVVKELENIRIKEQEMVKNIEAGRLIPEWVNEKLVEKGCEFIE
jgi:regulator of RNase E activity RraA